MISHNRPCFDSEEETAAVAVLRSGWVAQGPQVAAFEDEICAFLALPAGHAVAVSSGSAALYLALLALRATGKKVIAPAYSCRAVLNAIKLAGATAVWTDVGVDSANLEPRLVSSAVAPIAIVAHMFGLPAALPDENLPIIVEDCAQALGAEIAGRKVGTFGKVGIFSFGATKLMTTGGQGGMLVSCDREIVEFARKSRDYDVMPTARRRFNFQLTDLQAAIGRVQLRKLPTFLARREQIFRRYAEAGLKLLDIKNWHERPVRFRAVMRTDRAPHWQDRLAETGVHAIVPVTANELLVERSLAPRAAWLSRHTLSLPIYPVLADDDVDRIVHLLAS